MCGISGIFSFKNQKISNYDIEQINNALIHRGPDNGKILIFNNLALGQRRLSIQDLRTEGTAPLGNEDGKIWVTFNGEIYNFKILREDLLKKGHIFKTQTDTEVLVHLYEEYGVDMVNLLRGMFAFAIWDERKRRLHLFRDRLGVKPLFYSIDEELIIFASELKAITKFKKNNEINPYAIDTFLSFEAVYAPDTIFLGIRKLPQGHFMTIEESGKIEIHRYWSPSKKEQNVFQNFNEALEETEKQIEEAVKIRMIADVPVGAFLSGGIDSGLIVSYMAQNSSMPIDTFSLGFEGTHNELPFAKLVAEKYRTNHHEFFLTPDLKDLIHWTVLHFDEPFGDLSAIPTYCISKLARNYVTVALSGDGGDESFGGYEAYKQVLNLNQIARRIGPFKSLLKIAETGLQNYRTSNNQIARLIRLSKYLSSNLSDRYTNYMSIFKEEEKEMLYQKHFKEEISTQHNVLVSPDFDFLTNELDWMLAHDQLNRLSQCLNTKVDMASMANSLEVRSPFLDSTLINFAYSLPQEYKVFNGINKYILRKIAHKFLPPEIFNKPKTGFSFPLDKWLRVELFELLNDYLNEKSILNYYLNYKFIKKMKEEHLSNNRNWSNRLWLLLILEIWFRTNKV